ncbi:MAG TPA: efflux RND transporter periplasmic adaptor subunit, partial [Anaerolineales bacterium]
MTTGKKVLLSIGVVIVLLVILGFTIEQSRRNTVVVQTGVVKRQELSAIVTASGEIKPKTYVNIGANAFGKITHLYVKEGDRVKRGQLLAQIENVQPESDVAATRASLQASRTDAVAAEAAVNTAVANLKHAQSDYDHAKLDYDRAQALYQEQLIAKADYDLKEAAYDGAAAGLNQAQAALAQAKAQLASAHQRITQTEANLRRYNDVLSKTEYVAPFDGLITNLPVREGETVVIGIQNSPGSTLMTLANMSIITAEVMADETDIVNIQNGQEAVVTIDAIPNKTFKGVVTEIGNNAVLRSTGVSTSQSTSSSQEAKDFKVVVTLQDPPENLRPGISCTAKITTATRNRALVIPIQALAVRDRKDLAPAGDPAALPAGTKGNDNKEIQGVFVVHNRKAEFVPVETGIAGATDIEVLNGLKQGDEIVTGSYKILRTLRPGASVKID